MRKIFKFFRRRLNEKFILKLFNYNFLFLTGDTLVLDRWLWLKKKIKKVEKIQVF